MGGLTHLLDTNVLSEPLRARPHDRVLEHLAAHRAGLATSAISWQEMLFGLYRLPASGKRAQVERYLAQCVRGVLPILAFDEAAGRWQAEQRAALIAVGRTPAYVDSQIAAIAATRGLVLVTRNTRDFTEFDGLQVETWFEQ